MLLDLCAWNARLEIVVVRKANLLILCKIGLRSKVIKRLEALIDPFRSLGESGPVDLQKD